MKALLFTVLLLVSPQAALGAGQLTDLKHSFSSAKSEEERVRIAVKAIDAGLICFGCPISNVDYIFSTSHAKLDKGWQGSDGFFTGIVYLKPEFDFLNRPE